MLADGYTPTEVKETLGIKPNDQKYAQEDDPLAPKAQGPSA